MYYGHDCAIHAHVWSTIVVDLRFSRRFLILQKVQLSMVEDQKQEEKVISSFCQHFKTQQVKFNH